MPLLNPFLRSFFRSALPQQCQPVEDYVLLVPTTEILTSTRDRESGASYADLAGSDEFLGSHVLRVPNSTAGAQGVGGRESRGKPRQFTTFNGRTVVVKDSWVYSNKGFRHLNQAQLLNDVLYYPDSSEPQQWLIYFISKPLIGVVENTSTIPPYLRDRTAKQDGTSTGKHLTSRIPAQKKEVDSFNDLLMLFPMIARQMQPGLEKMFLEFEVSFERFKPLPMSPPSPSSMKSGLSSSRGSVRSSVSGDIYKQAADESEIRRSLESAIATAVDLFQQVDQSQLDLLASSTDLTGPAVDKLIERYVAEQLHDNTLFPRLCATKAEEDEELDHKITMMENVDITQVGIPNLDQLDKTSIARRISRGMKHFMKIGSAKSPQAMVECLLGTARSLTSRDDIDKPPPPPRSAAASVKSFSTVTTATAEKRAQVSAVTMNADMLVSLLLLVVIRSKVPNLHASLSYMRNFMFAEDVEQGEVGYVLSTLEAVLFHIAQDHVLVAASHANDKLWRSVKQGNLKAVSQLLELSQKESPKQSETSSLYDIEDGGKTPKGERSETPIPTPTATSAPPILTNGTTSAPEEILPPSKSSPEARPKTPNGILTNVTPSPAKSPKSPRHLLNGSVHISDSPPQKITIENMTEDEVPAEMADGKAPEKKKANDPVLEVQDEPPPHGKELAQEGPPAEDEFDAANAPSTGVASVRIDDLRPKGDDTDSVMSMQIDIPPLSLTRHVQSANPRLSIARFDIYDKPSALRFHRTRSITSISSMATISDRSMKQIMQAKHSASTSNTEAFAPDKLAKTRNRYDESILMMAVQERKAYMLQYLLDTPLFDLDYLLDDVREDGTTLLAAAVQVEDAQSIEYLLKILLKLPDEDLRNYLRIPDVNGRTVAHYLFSAPDLIPRLGRWLPWRAKDKNGQTPLFALCRSYDHPRYREMVGMGIKQTQATQMDNRKLLVDDHVDSKGNTLLHIAGHPSVLRSLLRADADVNAVNEKGFTPLMVASKYGRVEIVRTIFGDPRVNLLAKDSRGLTAVELAKDDDVRNRIDDLVLFHNKPSEDGRVTAVVRSFFVEDATIRVVLKSGAPSADAATYTVTTCRRSLTDFQFLATWLQYENPASWLPALLVSRSPYQIPSKPSRAVLREIQLRVDNFLRTLLMHPTFSTHELLWEFFLVPEMQQESLIERSKKKAELRVERVREDYVPVQDVREVEMFVSFAKDSVRSITAASRSVARRTTALRTAITDVPDTYLTTLRHLRGFKFMEDTPHLTAIAKFADTLTITEAHPYTLFHDDLRSILASLSGVTSALDRPKEIVAKIAAIQKQIDRHLVSLRRSERWPLGILDETRAKHHQEAAAKAQERHRERTNLACELRYTQSIAAQELAAFHEMHERQARQAVRELAKRQVVVEKDRLEKMRRALRVLKKPTGGKA